MTVKYIILNETTDVVSIPLIHNCFEIFHSLQPSAAQLFWTWSVPGLSLDTAATILSPQQDPKACQSCKLGFREAEDDHQREIGDGGHKGDGNRVWKEGGRMEGREGRRWWQLKIFRLGLNIDIFINIYQLSEIICIQTWHVSKIRLQRPLVFWYCFHGHYPHTHAVAMASAWIFNATASLCASPYYQHLLQSS